MSYETIAQGVCNDFAFDGVSPGPFSHNTVFKDMALGTSGAIYIAGTYTDEIGPKMMATRLYANGSPFPGFAEGGTYILKNLRTATAIASTGSSIVIGNSDKSLDRLNASGGPLGTNVLDYETTEIVSNNDNIYVLGQGSYFVNEQSGFESILTISGFNIAGNPIAGFGNSGVVTILPDETKMAAFGSHLVRTPEGKFMVAVVLQKIVALEVVEREVVIYRLLNDGTLDTTWGNDGILVEPEHKTYQIGDLLVNGNGKVVVTGNFQVEGEVTQLLTHRWNDDGTFDTSFNGGIAFGDDEVIVNSMVATENHELLFVGKTDETDSRFVMGGYDNVGNNNSGFSTQKFLPNDPFIKNGSLEKVILLSTGKLLACGQVTLTDGSTRGIVIRINSDGTLDASFADNGIYMPNVVQQGADLAIAVQEDGKYVTVGAHALDHVNGGHSAPAIARFMPDGRMDTNFGYRGGSYKELGQDNDGNDFSGYYKNVSILPDGKIICFGQFNNANGFLAARYTEDGILDTDFNTNGLLTIKGGCTGSTCKQLAGYGEVDNEGRIVMIGSATTVNGSNYQNPIVMRLLPDGSIDNSFGQNGNGRVFLDLSPVFEGFTTGALFPNNSILAGGHVYKLPEAVTYSTIAKFTVGGILDNGFGEDGVVYYKPEGALSATNVFVKIQADGRILSLINYLDAQNKSRYGLIRLLSTGQIDASFGTSGFVEFRPQDKEPRTVDGLNIDSEGNILITGSVQNVGGVTSKYDASGAFLKTYSYSLSILPTGEPLLTADDRLVLIADGGREGFGIVCYNLEASVCGSGEEINILTQPASQVVDEGINVTFTFVATGSNLTYQWRKNEVDLPGETSPTLVLSDVSANDNGLYYCVISNACDVQYTSSVVLVVNIVTNLNELNERAFKVYPNPTSGKIVFNDKLAHGTIIDIYSIQGQKISSFSIKDGRQEIDLHNLNEGIYTLIIYNEEMNYTQRVLINK
jgi:uncharacterized delta-60 repeat protein